MSTRKFDAERTFFTADTHFGHERAVLFRESQSFSSVEEMDSLMIENWNSTIKKGDTVFHLGDFYMGKDLKAMDHILGNLNGNLTFIAGNHDHKKERKILAEFGSVHDLLQAKTKIEGENVFVVICHYPLKSWNMMHHGALHLHGHCHGSLLTKTNRTMDVGVDCNNYKPIGFMDIWNELKDQKIPLVDHHSKSKQ